MKMKTIQLETFKEIGDFEKKLLIKSEPYSYYGAAFIKKFKVTISIEEIPEPLEVYQERIQKLWEECSDSRHYKAIQSEADKIGYKLKGMFGQKRNRV